MRYLIEIVSTILLFTTFTRIHGQRQGDLCVLAGTIQPGICRHIMSCSAVLEAAYQGLPYQVCASPENRLIVCCPWVPGQETRLQARCQANTTTPREGDNCKIVNTGRAGVCSRFANCQIAIEAASKGQSPQICAVEGTAQIICCPLVTVAEGDQCLAAETGRAGKCLRISKCPVAVEAALKGITPQICALDGSVPIVCCEGVVEGDNCTVVDTGKAGVCKPFANCQTAKEAVNKGILPQTCDVKGTLQIVCCPLSTVVEGSNCAMADTGRAGVCRPFVNCQSAKEASVKGIFPQTCDVEGTVQNVCCPPETIIKGSNCTLKHTGIAGVCRPFANCQTAQEGACKGILPQRCDLTDNESELVCCTKAACPPLAKGLGTQLGFGSKAADYCLELAEKIHPCQETLSGWTRGDMCPLLTDSNTEYYQTPMMTAAEAPYYGYIGVGQRGAITWREKSVTLVSDQWVLSSASVIDLFYGYSDLEFVGLGGGAFAPRYNPDEIYGITTKHVHPLYDGRDSPAYNSIALLQLDTRVTFTARILPACLDPGTLLPDSGFIRTDYPGVKTTMQRVSQEECSVAYPTDSWHHPYGVQHDEEICSRQVNTTSCLTTISGSPLTLQKNPRVACTHLLVGLVTYTSSPCLVTNIRISYFIPWIEGIVWPESGVVG